MPETASPSSTSFADTIESIPFPMLDIEGRNWAIWKERFYLSAVAQGHKSHLEDGAIIPKKGEPTFNEWEMIQARLKERILSTIPYSIYVQIKDKETVKLMFDELDVIIERKTRMLVWDLRRKLTTTSWREGTRMDLRSHFAELQKIREDLEAAGHNIEDRYFVMTLMTSLPASFDDFLGTVDLISRLAGTDVTPSQLIEMVLEEHDRRGISTSSGSAGDHVSKDQKLKCVNCKKKGHMKVDCWAKGGGKEVEGPKEGSKREGPKSRPKDKAKTRTKVAEMADDDHVVRTGYAHAVEWCGIAIVDE